jgi:hypothetical protein
MQITQESRIERKALSSKVLEPDHKVRPGRDLDSTTTAAVAYMAYLPPLLSPVITISALSSMVPTAEKRKRRAMGFYKNECDCMS